MRTGSALGYRHYITQHQGRVAICGTTVSAAQYERKLPLCNWCRIDAREQAANRTVHKMGAVELINNNNSATGERRALGPGRTGYARAATLGAGSRNWEGQLITHAHKGEDDHERPAASEFEIKERVNKEITQK